MFPATSLFQSSGAVGHDACPLEIVVVMSDGALGELLREALHRDLRLRVVAVCRLAVEAEETLRRERDCGLVIADPWLADAPGADLLQRIRALRPALPLLLYTTRVDPLTMDVMLRAGAGGVVERGAPLGELLAAVPKVARGGTVFSESVSAVMRGFVTGAGAEGGRSLTRREQEIGRRLVRGEGVPEIATALSLAPRTVLNTRRRIAMKLGIDTANRRARPEWLI